ncbi:MAG: hypothetical protein HY919_00910 [Elusimicrobia bacterium]|nr:hypothetical protein [Elusimicrobiota bacterium]
MKKPNFHFPNLPISGFTIVELMINVVTISIIAGALSALFFKWIQLWYLSSAKAEIQRDARTCVSAVDKHLRQATASSVVIDRYDSNQPPYSRLFFTKAGQQFIYYQKGQEFYEVINSTKTIAKCVRCVQFIYPETADDSIIAMSIAFEKKTYSSQTKALQLSVAKVRIMN